jgi:hypothetical protein
MKLRIFKYPDIIMFYQYNTTKIEMFTRHTVSAKLTCYFTNTLLLLVAGWLQLNGIEAVCLCNHPILGNIFPQKDLHYHT